MSHFANDEQTTSVEEMMPWDVQTDRETGAFAFVNAKARLSILVLPPDITGMVDRTVGAKWGARVVHRCPYSTLKPYFLALEDTEIELIEKVEDHLIEVTRKDQAMFDAVIKLQRSGLVIESPVDVVAQFAMSEANTADRVRYYLRVGAGEAGKPSADPGRFAPAELAATLQAIGLGEAESWDDASFYDIPAERTA